MQQARIALGVAVAGYFGHWAYVARERDPAFGITGRLLQFSPGSQDEIVSSQLRTGDLLLFSRDATLYTGLAAITIASRKALTGCAYDHVGVVVVRGHVPHVLERSPNGCAHLRRFDARVKMSTAREIVWRPLHATRPVDAAALSAFIEETVEVDSPGLLLKECFIYPVRRDANASLEYVQEAYAAMGVTAAAGTRLRMLDVVDVQQRAAPRAPFTNATLGKPAWIRDLR